MNMRNHLTPTMLLILDGFGYNQKSSQNNAIAAAHMPTFSALASQYPATLLHASGRHVGLLDGYMGNSEVGHLTMGAGRIVDSQLKVFSQALDNQSLFDNKLLQEKLFLLKEQKKSLHLIGLVSDGGVHSHENHLHGLITFANKIGLSNTFVHAFLDGRDVPPRSAACYLERLTKICAASSAIIASIHGRFYAMDRDSNWNRTQQTYNVLSGQTTALQQDWHNVLKESYAQNITDEFIKPILLAPQGFIHPGDGVIFFNTRPDRARQLTECFINPAFTHFKRQGPTTSNQTLAFFITATRYKQEFAQYNNEILFEQKKIYHTLLDELEQQLSPPQNNVFIIGETEKYAHITYFFKGMRDEPSTHETRILIPSLKEKNYVHHPAMSAPSITQHIIASLQKKLTHFYLVNLANADMVGHSGNLQATIQACEVIDQQLTYLYQEVVVRHGGTLIITADHGNAEEMKNTTSQSPITSHTTNPVPFVFVHEPFKKTTTMTNPFDQKVMHGLCHVAPTILTHLGLQIPGEMEQNTIISRP